MPSLTFYKLDCRLCQKKPTGEYCPHHDPNNNHKRRSYNKPDSAKHPLQFLGINKTRYGK